jgi:hypothetical protein
MSAVKVERHAVRIEIFAIKGLRCERARAARPLTAANLPQKKTVILIWGKGAMQTDPKSSIQLETEDV